MTPKARAKKATVKTSNRSNPAKPEEQGVKISVDNVGELLLLESINSPFIGGSEQPLKIYDIAVAFYVLTRKNNTETRNLIAKGEFFPAVDKWMEDLHPGYLNGVGGKIQEAIQTAIDRPVSSTPTFAS